ncbi:MAG: alpha/beta hydrolase [Cyanobacteria bacterium J06642_2]
MPIRLLILTATTLFHAIASWLENRQPPPGQRLDVGGYCLHYSVLGSGGPTIVLDHSLGGVEGYVLFESLAQRSRVVIYDRAGYGWSDLGPHPRTSDRVVTELDALLTGAGIEPPYLLVGDSFGSYNVRLYAHRFPEKVVGLVLTDGLHESGMLQMPLSLQLVKWFFVSGFGMALLGSALGLVRLLEICRVFELVKPELRRFPREALAPVKRSFVRPKHWLTMAQELLGLDASGRQVSIADGFGDLPIVSIKAEAFFRPSIWTLGMKLGPADRLRDRMHVALSKLSSRCESMSADASGHFVWVDRPDVILKAVDRVLEQVQEQSG